MQFVGVQSSVIFSYSYFYFGKISSNVPNFISGFSDLGLPFFSVSLAESLLILIFSKKQLFIPLVFFLFCYSSFYFSLF